MIRKDALSSQWPKKNLGEVVDFLDHLRVPVKQKDRKSGLYPYYGANGQQGSIDGYLFDEPLILLAEDGGHFGTSGKTIAYRVDGKCWVNNHAHVLRPKPSVDIDFLCRHLESYDVTPFITGTTRGKLTKAATARIPIIFPPLEEQKRIAAILDKADAIRKKRQQAIELTEQFLRSAFLDMFGDPITNPKGWEKKTLKESGSLVQIGPFGSLLHKGDYISGGIPLINPKHIINSAIVVGYDETITHAKADELKKYCLQKGDVIMGRRGEMGRCAIVSENVEGMLCGTGSLFIRPNPNILTQLYLSKVISSDAMKDHLEREAWGVTMANLNRSKIESLSIPLPPLDLQQSFTDLVEQAEKQKIRLHAHLGEIDVLFASLQSHAFRG